MATESDTEVSQILRWISLGLGLTMLGTVFLSAINSWSVDAEVADMGNSGPHV